MENILFLKSKSLNDYIQDSCFRRQMAKQKLFLFKMLFYGLISGVDLVRHMQPSGRDELKLRQVIQYSDSL
jgi:hypothetical protein